MCQIALSRLVPVEALVGRYPTNKLIGDRPLPDLRTFDHRTMRSSDVIRYYRHFRKGTEVPPLFLCPGYVTYLFLTRPPLNVLPLPSTHLVRLACLSHAASVRSEPGSNSSLCIVGTAPANRNGVAYEKKGSYTHLLRSEDMLRRRAGQSPTRLHTDCLDRLQTAVMPQAPFATALAASHPHNRLHCLLVKEQSGDCKLQSPRYRIVFDTERTATHTTRQFSPVQRIEQLFPKTFHGSSRIDAPARTVPRRGSQKPPRSTAAHLFLCHTIGYAPA